MMHGNDDKSALTLAQWLPKPATRWMPRVTRPLRGLWSPRREEASKRFWLVIVMVMAIANACFGQGAITISFSSTRYIPPLSVARFGIWTTEQPTDSPTTPVPVVTTVPDPATEPITIRVWDSSSGPIQSWDVAINPAQINSMLPQAPPMPWLQQNSSGLVSFSELLSQSGLSSQEAFVGPVAPAEPVPEPGVMVLIGLGVGLIFYRRSERKQRA